MLDALGPLGWVRAADREQGRCYHAVAHPGFRLLCCDSKSSGTHAGELGPAQLALHDQPFRSGIPAMDVIGLLDSEALAAVLARHRHLQRVLTGHLHRQLVAEVGGTVVTGVGSTLRRVHLDLAAGSPGQYVDEPPSLAWHVLDTGRVVTHYLPVAGRAATYDPF